MTTVAERPVLQRNAEQVADMPHAAFVETDALLGKIRQTDHKGWDVASRAIVESWNREESTLAVEGARQAVDDAAKAETTPFYPVELGPEAAEGARSEEDIYRLWVLRDHGVNDPDTLSLPEYAHAYWQLSGTAFKELRQDRPRWQRMIGWRHGSDKRAASQAAEYLLLGDVDGIDGWFRPDISSVPRKGSLAERLGALAKHIPGHLAPIKKVAQRVMEYGPMPVLQHGLDTLRAKIEKPAGQGLALEIGVTAASTAVLYASARGVEVAVDFGTNFQNELQADLYKALMPDHIESEQ